MFWSWATSSFFRTDRGERGNPQSATQRAGEPSVDHKAAGGAASLREKASQSKLRVPSPPEAMPISRSARAGMGAEEVYLVVSVCMRGDADADSDLDFAGYCSTGY